ncbi:uncharacterized protein Z518_07567 [Rhinocladiella mackenziei CBS 650.93]|uniref:Complex III subunit 9 n=1 Tax=Rhinocladiella mackenziei CBS 650.93 TaxID=1442369 RepID=A0A0D2IDY8_9EURO|nr:uncharacterized protein Z518_07567 [Rhinocladiella mackenziei CBS 650.93]KIX04014.1 hypothetical protein Z518_07567 [Rhinocladiella mackenziei CBS 650.93]
MALVSRIANGVYTGLFKKNAAFLTTVFLGAFAFEIGFEYGANAMWDQWNKGRQWKEIKHRYMTPPDEEE